VFIVDDEIETRDDEIEAGLTISQRALQRTQRQKRLRTNESQYRIVNYIPPTSNRAERAFSRLKLIMTDHRSCMHPKILENFLYLRENRKFWDQSTMEEAIKRTDIDWDDSVHKMVSKYDREVNSDDDDLLENEDDDT